MQKKLNTSTAKLNPMDDRGPALLYGIANQPSGTAAQALQSMGIDQHHDDAEQAGAASGVSGYGSSGEHSVNSPDFGSLDNVANDLSFLASHPGSAYALQSGEPASQMTMGPYESALLQATSGDRSASHAPSNVRDGQPTAPMSAQAAGRGNGARLTGRDADSPTRSGNSATRPPRHDRGLPMDPVLTLASQDHSLSTAETTQQILSALAKHMQDGGSSQRMADGGPQLEESGGGSSSSLDPTRSTDLPAKADAGEKQLPMDPLLLALTGMKSSTRAGQMF